MSDTKDLKTSTPSEVKTHRLLDHQKEEVPIFVLHLTTENELARKTRLTARLKYHDIIDSATFVEGVNYTNIKVTEIRKDYQGDCTPKEAACIMSHLVTIANYVLKSKAKYGLILESDAVPINDFPAEFIKVAAKIPNETSLVMLNSYISNYNDVKNIDDTFCTIGKKCYSALGYLISHDYAEKLLGKFLESYKLNKSGDVEIKWKPFIQWNSGDCLNEDGSKTRITSELITINSGGLMTRKQLFIDESLDTSIQEEIHTQWHLQYYKQFDHKKYAEAEYACEHESVLKLWGLI